MCGLARCQGTALHTSERQCPVATGHTKLSSKCAHLGWVPHHCIRKAALVQQQHRVAAAVVQLDGGRRANVRPIHLWALAPVVVRQSDGDSTDGEAQKSLGWLRRSRTQACVSSMCDCHLFLACTAQPRRRWRRCTEKTQGPAGRTSPGKATASAVSALVLPLVLSTYCSPFSPTTLALATSAGLGGAQSRCG